MAFARLHIAAVCRYKGLHHIAVDYHGRSGYYRRLSYAIQLLRRNCRWDLKTWKFRVKKGVKSLKSPWRLYSLFHSLIVWVLKAFYENYVSVPSGQVLVFLARLYSSSSSILSLFIFCSSFWVYSHILDVQVFHILSSVAISLCYLICSTSFRSHSLFLSLFCAVFFFS